MVEGRPVPAVHGVWRSRGYGYVVGWVTDGPKLFHVAGDFCYADPRPERDPDELFVSIGPWDATRSPSRASSGRPASSSTGCASLPAACTDTGSMVAGRASRRWWRRPSPTSIPRLPSAGSTGGRERRRPSARSTTHRRRRAVQDASHHAGGGRRSSCRAARQGGGRGTRLRARRGPTLGRLRARQERGRPAHRGRGMAAGLPARHPRRRAAGQRTPGRGRQLSCGGGSEISAISTC